MIALAILSAVSICMALSVPFRAPGMIYQLPLTEDGYFALSVARNAAKGLFFTADGLTKTNGFQPLWPMLVAAGTYAVCGADECLVRVATGFSSLFIIVAAVLWARLSSLLWGQETILHQAIFATLYLTQHQLLVQHFNGLETGMALALIAVAGLLFTYSLDRPGIARSALAGVVLGLIALCRIDAAAFVIVYCIAAALAQAGTPRSRFVSFAVMSSVAALVFAPWIAYNIALSGHPMPVSGRALAIDTGILSASARIANTVGGLGRDLLPNILGEILRGGANIAILLAILTGVVLIAPKPSAGLSIRNNRERRTRLFAVVVCIYGIALLFAYTINSSATYFYPRYFVVFALPFVSAAAALTVTLFTRASFLAVPALALAVVPGWLAVAGWHGLPAGLALNSRQSYTNPPLLGQVELASRFAQPSELVGALQTGTLSFFRSGVVNLDGKVNISAYEARRQGRLADYVNSSHVDVLIDFSSFLERDDKAIFGRPLSEDFERIYPSRPAGLYDMAVLRRRTKLGF